jgi:hypothetical protein
MYQFLCNFLLIGSLFYEISLFSRSYGQERKSWIVVYAVGGVAPITLMAAPVLTSFYGNLLTARTGVALSIVGALLMLAFVAVCVVRRPGRPGFWYAGWCVMGALAAGLVLFAGINQLAFVVPKGSITLWDWRFVADQVKDMPPCYRKAILVRWKPGDKQAVYRCPDDDIFVLNGSTLNPYLPWPNYTEGSSADLAVALNKAVRNAKPLKAAGSN